MLVLQWQWQISLSAFVFIIIIIIEICKAPTLRLKALNKHTHIMYIEMENVIQKNIKKYRQVFKHNYAKDAHTHARTHARTHALYRLIGVKDNVA